MSCALQISLVRTCYHVIAKLSFAGFFSCHLSLNLGEGNIFLGIGPPKIVKNRNTSWNTPHTPVRLIRPKHYERHLPRHTSCNYMLKGVTEREIKLKCILTDKMVTSRQNNLSTFISYLACQLAAKEPSCSGKYGLSIYRKIFSGHLGLILIFITIFPCIKVVLYDVILNRQISTCFAI